MVSKLRGVPSYWAFPWPGGGGARPWPSGAGGEESGAGSGPGPGFLWFAFDKAMDSLKA